MDSAEWDRRYAATPTMWGTAPNPTVVAHTEDLSPGRAVDLACGDGRHAAWLARRGWRVEAVDFARAAIEQARRRPDVRHDRIVWSVDDALTWEPGGPVDLVVISYLHLPALGRVLRRAAEWLAPDGRLLYLGHARENLAYGVGGPSDPAVLPDGETMATALSGHRIHRLQHVDRPAATATAIDLLAIASPWPAEPREPR